MPYTPLISWKVEYPLHCVGYTAVQVKSCLKTWFTFCKGNHHMQPLDWQEDTGLSMKSTLYILQMLKSTSRAEVTSNSQKSSLSSLEASDNQSVENNFLTFHSKFFKSVQVDLKACLGLPILPYHYLGRRRLVFWLYYFMGHFYFFVLPTNVVHDEILLQ